VEGYRSYPEGRSDYSDGMTASQPEYGPQPEYSDGGGTWYGERSYPEPERYEETRREYGRPSPGPAPGPGPVSGAAPAPGSGAPMNPGRMPAVGPRPGLSADEPPPPRRPAAAPGSPGPAGDGVYRSKRPAAAVLFGVPAAILELPALFLLADAAFADPVSASGVVSAVCVVLALPLVAFGLYSVATGAVRAAGPNSAQAWLRPPVAYLSVGLVLFVAAGLAA